MTEAASTTPVGLSAVNLWSWYPIVASADLQAGAVMRIMLHGERLVAWRSHERQIGVWNDRCPHRGMSLSFGATIGEKLVCAYHGWEFGSDGNCRRIPAHPALTPSRAARVRVYPTLEACGYVWACLGEPMSALPECGLIENSPLRPIRSMHVPAAAETVALILLSHPLTVHAERTPTGPAEYQRDGDTLTVTHPDENGSASCCMRLGLPPIVIGKLGAAGETLRYAALVQPVDENKAVIHLALVGNGTQVARLALNDALVRLRGKIPLLAHSTLLPELRDVIGDAAPLAATNLMSKGLDDGENNRPNRAQ